MWRFIGYVIMGIIVFFGVYAWHCYTYKKLRSENKTIQSWSQWHEVNATPLFYIALPMFWPLSIIFLLIWCGCAYVLATIRKYIGVED